jgi:hypothetical protein
MSVPVREMGFHIGKFDISLLIDVKLELYNMNIWKLRNFVSI